MAVEIFEKLSPDMWCQLVPSTSEIFDVNGNSIMAMGSVTLQIKLGQVIFKQIFIVCNITQDGILGQDFLLKQVRKVDYRRMVLNTNDDQEIQCWIGGKANMVCRVEVKDTITIPPRSSMLLPVEVPGSAFLTDYGYVEGKCKTPKQILTVPGIIETQQLTPVINVVNYGDTEVTLQKNESVGTCESYMEGNLEVEQIRAVQVGQTHTVDTGFPEHLNDLLKRSSENLDEDQKKALTSLLRTYGDVFSRTGDDIGRTSLVTHRINTGNAIPIRQRSRRMPLGKQEMEKTEVKRMLEKGVIEPSRSPWASNIVLVLKKNGQPRFCVDYRMLNEITKKDAYPLPRVDECLDSLAGAQWFSSMDLNSGFWQIGMAPEDKEKTAFLTSLGLYQFTVMPFGLANSPSTFERLMENVLRGLQWQELLLYMDDIISVSSTFHEGLERLEKIFQRLQGANLKLKPSKCVFFQKQVGFLGHIVSETGISTDPEKTKAVQEWPIPKSAKQVRSFLGLSSYYRRFVQGFACIARPLHKTCEKDKKFVWTDECQAAFETLKTALVSSPILAYPLPGVPFILDTDASDKSVGAVMSQLQEGSERVIAYMSKTMNIHEQAYCVTRKELLAVVTALKTFHPYLYGQEVLLRTDNAAVSWMRNLKKPTGQTARWLQELGTYNLNVVHRAGKKHSNADALSRRPCKSCENQESGNHESDNSDDDTDTTTEHDKQGNGNHIEVVRVCTRSQTNPRRVNNSNILEGWDHGTIRQKQLEDADIGLLMTFKEDGGSRPAWDQVSMKSSSMKTIWRQWERLEINNGMMYRRFYTTDGDHEFKLQLLVPEHYRKTVFKHFHDNPTGGHLGPDKMLSTIQQSFYWPAMKKSITQYCQECDKCAARKPSKQARAPLGQYLVGEPMERVAIDILGPLPITENGNRYILVLCDCFSKWTEAYALPNQESSTITRTIVNEFICRFGTPLQIHSDQGRSFEAKLFTDLCDFLKIDKTRSTSHHPQSNGNVERFNRTLLCMLTHYCENNQQRWDEVLPQVLMAYRSSAHASTGQTPNMMMLGRNITLPLEAVIPRPEKSDDQDAPTIEEYIETLQDNLGKSHTLARTHLKRNVEYQKRHYDLKAKKREFKIGQPVWLYDASRKVGVCHKLTSKWKGPFLVMKRLDDLTYLVKRSRKQSSKVYHIDRLLPYKGKNPPSWFSSEQA